MLFDNINISYKEDILYKNYTIDIEDNKTTVLIGKSGIGKTSLLEYISSILLKNKIEFSYVFQEHRLVPWININENLNIIYDDTCIMSVREALSIVELNKDIYKYPYQLSGGMRQRVNLARAIMKPGEVMLLDEPFKSIDIRMKEILINYIKNLVKIKNITCIMVTHDLNEANCMADKIINIEEEKRKCT